MNVQDACPNCESSDKLEPMGARCGYDQLWCCECGAVSLTVCDSDEFAGTMVPNWSRSTRWWSKLVPLWLSGIAGGVATCATLWIKEYLGW